jgi:hypothetical protein
VPAVVQFGVHPPVARTGLTALPHFSRVVSLIWRRTGRPTDGRVTLTAQGSQLARTGGCDLPQLAHCRSLLRGVTHARSWAWQQVA